MSDSVVPLRGVPMWVGVMGAVVSTMGEAGRAFIPSLLSKGTQVIASAPEAAAGRVADPNPTPGWRRMKAMSGDPLAPTADALMLRACRYIVLLPLVYRLGMMPAALVASAVVGWHSQIFLVGVGTTVLSILGLVAVLCAGELTQGALRAAIPVDAAVAVGLNLWLAAVSTGPLPVYTEVSWAYFIGSVALSTLVRGAPSGVVLVVASVPLQLLMKWLSGTRNFGIVELAGRSASALAALLTAGCALVLLGMAVRLAMAIGAGRGRSAERERTRRFVHDTALQALESLALAPPGNAPDLERELATLRATARASATLLRTAITEDEDAGERGIGGELAALATDMARFGLRTQLIVADAADGTLPEARRVALRDAVREALRNTVKHAGTNEVLVRIEEREDGLAVIVRDHGNGFDERDHPPGFGISRSIQARLTEVGGRSAVSSRPGRGTKVTLWVPR